VFRPAPGKEAARGFDCLATVGVLENAARLGNRGLLEGMMSEIAGRHSRNPRLKGLMEIAVTRPDLIEGILEAVARGEMTIEQARR
jgi:hypothetical protein